MADLVTVIEQLAGQADRIARDASTATGPGLGLPAAAAIAGEVCALAQQSANVVRSITHSLRLLHGGRFTFRTLEEARMLASVVAGMYPDPKRVEIGISELLLNAVEHGNLGITYDEKTRLLASGELEQEAARRMTLPEYASRLAILEVERTPTEIRLLVKDQGQGFDWRPFLEFSGDRMQDSHGRGIATARLMCFTSLEYRGNGNEVLAVSDLSMAVRSDVRRPVSR